MLLLHRTKPVSQEARILQALKKAGSHGLYNYELSKICLSWHRRITDLRQEGYNIQHVQVRRSTHKYYLNIENI